MTHSSAKTHTGTQINQTQQHKQIANTVHEAGGCSLDLWLYTAAALCAIPLAMQLTAADGLLTTPLAACGPLSERLHCPYSLSPNTLPPSLPGCLRGCQAGAPAS